MINLNSILIRNNNIDAIEMDGEKAMMDLEEGRYYTLNKTGSVIWDKLQEEKSILLLIKELLKEYDVEEKKCEDEIIVFLNKLINDKLIKVV